MRCFPWKRGVKKSADIGRIASKPVKLAVSGKNYSSEDRVAASIKKLKIHNISNKHSQILPNDNMNHVIDSVNQNNEVEEMDTQEGKCVIVCLRFLMSSIHRNTDFTTKILKEIYSV